MGSEASFDFNAVAITWASGAATIDSGTALAAEATEDPFTYKSRGAFFNGTAKLMTLEAIL